MEEKKSILFISPYLPSEYSGHAGAQLIFRNLTALSEKYFITLITFINTNEVHLIDELTNSGIDVQYKIFDRNIKGIIPMLLTLKKRIFPYLRALFKIEPFFAAKYYYSEMNVLISEVIGKKEFSAVQFEYNIMNHYVDNFPNIKKILNLHDVSTKLNWRRFQLENKLISKFRKRISYLVWNRYESKLLQKFDSVITLTEEDKSYISQWENLPPVFVIPPQINLSDKLPVLKKSKKIVFIASFNREPNIQAVEILMEQVFPKIINCHPEYRLEIAGKYLPDKLIRKIELEKNINYLGFIDNVDEFISEAVLMIAPIYIGSGLKMKIPHALSCSVPVLTTTVGAEGINISENDGLFIEDQIEKMTERGIKLLSKPEVLTELGIKGKKRVIELFSKDAIVEKLSALYQRLI